MNILRQLDPHGVHKRANRRLKRRQYWSKVLMTSCSEVSAHAWVLKTLTLCLRGWLPRIIAERLSMHEALNHAEWPRMPASIVCMYIRIFITFFGMQLILLATICRVWLVTFSSYVCTLAFVYVACLDIAHI